MRWTDPVDGRVAKVAKCSVGRHRGPSFRELTEFFVRMTSGRSYAADQRPELPYVPSLFARSGITGKMPAQESESDSYGVVDDGREHVEERARKRGGMRDVNGGGVNSTGVAHIVARNSPGMTLFGRGEFAIVRGWADPSRRGRAEMGQPPRRVRPSRRGSGDPPTPAENERSPAEEAETCNTHPDDNTEVDAVPADEYCGDGPDRADSRPGSQPGSPSDPRPGSTAPGLDSEAAVVLDPGGRTHASTDSAGAARPEGGPAGAHRKAASPIAPEAIMANMETALKEAMTIEGALGVALVDYTSGMALGVLGGSKEFDLNVAAAGNTDVMRAKMRTMEMLHLGDQIEDVLITLGKQYHVIRPLAGRAGKGLFIYLVLTKERANLAMARHQLKRIEEEIEV